MVYMKKELIEARSRVVKLVRRYFDEQGFLELQTPRLVGLPGQEPYLEPMWTEVAEQNGAKHRAALITSPEYAMKRMLANGFDKIYDLGPCFRNGEPWDGTHDTEFLMTEWYEKGIGLSELMDRTEAMVRYVARNLERVAWNVDDKPFRRLTVVEAMKQYANVDLESALGDRDAMAKIAIEHGQTVSENDSWDDLFFKVFLSEVESKLGEVPTFLTHYPASMAALAQRDPNDPRYALRTELYIGDLELANGFVELADPIEQRKRFEEEQELRRSLGKETWPIDERFMEALPNMGQAAGIAFGVDRLAMLLTNTKSISDLMPIPVQERF
jgi:lysyl-tRNA synthetase class 2